MRVLDVLVLYNVPRLGDEHPDAASEAGVLEAVEAVTAALAKAGHRPRPVALRSPAGLLAELARGAGTDLVFNLCEGFAGRGEGEAHVAAAIELTGLPLTGSSSDTLALVRHKPRTKALLVDAGLPTAESVFLADGVGEDTAQRRKAEGGRRELPVERGDQWERLERLLAAGLCIVKPALEDASLGIDESSVVDDLASLQRQIEHVRARYGPVLVERFIPGREINVGVIDLGHPQVLPLAEIEFPQAGPHARQLVSYDAKWAPQSAAYRSTAVCCPALVEPKLADQIARQSLAAVALADCRDYARVDWRIDPSGTAYILEINANPDLSPSAGLARAVGVAGIDYDEFIARLVEHVWQSRRGEPAASTAAPISRETGPSSAGVRRRRAPAMTLRGLAAADVQPLGDMLAACGVFRDDEVSVGREVLKLALASWPDGDYCVTVAESEGVPIGWACHGRVPLTDATFDLYWIAVEPKYQASGVGRVLVEHLERVLRTQHARWLLAETSASPVYESTRQFYLRTGFRLLSEIPDFYRAGDGRLIFGKRLDGKARD